MDHQSNENKQDIAVKEVAELSKVTSKAKPSFFKTPVFRIIAGVCLLFTLLMYFGKEATSDTTGQTVHESMGKAYNPTLNQNLERLHALKKEELATEQQRQDEMRVMLLKAQERMQAKPQNQPHAQIYYEAKKPRKKKIPKELKDRMRASTTLVNVEYSAPNAQPVLTNTQTMTSQSVNNESANAAFLNQNTGIDTVSAGRIAHPSYTIAAGEVIAATLETAINSQLPGMVRAITTRDIYSLNARRRLIPKGSELIGQYASGSIGPAQDRVLIRWTRVKLPNGIVANLNSPSTDTLGRSGMSADAIDHHFVERFGSSLLFSVLGAYTANAGVNGLDGYNSASQYRMSVVQSFQKAASERLNQNASIPPTLKIAQGHSINVFVARDVSFYAVLKGGQEG